MPGISNALSGASAAVRPASNPVLRAMLSRMVLNDVRNGAGPARCRMTHTRGTHERMAYADAMSVSRSVMEAGKAALSSDDQVSIGRGINLLGTKSAEQVGPVLVEYLTTFGAVRAAIVELLQEGVETERLAPLLKKVDKNLVTIGIRMGECKGVPDAARNERTGRVCDAVEAGKHLMVKCAGIVGSEELLRGVAQSILPNSILQSLTERQPHLVEAFKEPEGAQRLLDVIVSTAAHKLEAGLISHIGTGGAESFSGAVLDLLKTAEYIVPGQKGQAGESPADPADVNAPARPDLPRNFADAGAPVNYTNVHTPVKVVNELGDLVKFMERDRSLPLNEVRNLVKDAHRIGQRLGATQERLRSQSDLIAKLLEDNARLRNIVGRTEFESRGTDPRNDLDGHKLREYQATISTQSIDLGSLDSLGTPSPRRVHVAERKQQGSNDSTQKIIRQDDRSENLLERGSGNGNGGTRRAPPGSEDQTDGSSSSKQPSDPKRPPGGDQLDLTRSDRSKFKDPQSQGSGNITGDTVYKELQHYFKEFGHGDGSLPVDPFRPEGPRRLMSRRGQPVPFGQPDRTHSPADFVEYRNARAVNANKPFVAPYSGLRLEPGVTAKKELDRLLEQFPGSLKPSDVLASRSMAPAPRSRAATPTPMSPLEQAFNTFRNRNVMPAAVEGQVLARRNLAHAIPLTPSFEQDRGDELVEVSAPQIVVERISEVSPPMLPPRDWLKPEGQRSGGMERTRSVSVSSDDSSDGYEYGSRIISDSKVSKARQPHRDRDPRVAAIDTLRANSSLFRDLGISPVVSTLTRSETLATRQAEEASVLRRAALEGAKVSGGQVSRQQSVEDVLSDLDEKWGLVDENVDSGNESPTPLIESRSESPLAAIWKSGIADRPEFASVRATLSKNTLDVLRNANAANVPKKQQGAA